MQRARYSGRMPGPPRTPPTSSSVLTHRRSITNRSSKTAPTGSSPDSITTKGSPAQRWPSATAAPYACRLRTRSYRLHPCKVHQPLLRNTVESVETVRRLSAMGIYIFFEKENIDTGKMEGELRPRGLPRSTRHTFSECHAKMPPRWQASKRLTA